MKKVWAVSLSIFRLRAEERFELSFSVEWKRTLTNNPKTKDCNLQASKCPTQGQHSTVVPPCRTLFGRHSVQHSCLVVPVDFHFTPNCWMHYLCVAYCGTTLNPGNPLHSLQVHWCVHSYRSTDVLCIVQLNPGNPLHSLQIHWCGVCSTTELW